MGIAWTSALIAAFVTAESWIAQRIGVADFCRPPFVGHDGFAEYAGYRAFSTCNAEAV